MRRFMLSLRALDDMYASVQAENIDSYPNLSREWCRGRRSRRFGK